MATPPALDHNPNCHKRKPNNDVDSEIIIASVSGFLNWLFDATFCSRFMNWSNESMSHGRRCSVLSASLSPKFWFSLNISWTAVAPESNYNRCELTRDKTASDEKLTMFPARTPRKSSSHFRVSSLISSISLSRSWRILRAPEFSILFWSAYTSTKLYLLRICSFSSRSILTLKKSSLLKTDRLNNFLQQHLFHQNRSYYTQLTCSS